MAANHSLEARGLEHRLVLKATLLAAMGKAGSGRTGQLHQAHRAEAVTAGAHVSVITTCNCVEANEVLMVMSEEKARLESEVGRSSG